MSIHTQVKEPVAKHPNPNCFSALDREIDAEHEAALDKQHAERIAARAAANGRGYSSNEGW